jgi:hypothetical protein
MAQTMQEVIDNYGEWAHGGNVAETAVEWECCGFAPEQAAAWLDARCWDPGAAQELAAEGVTPEQAAVKVDADESYGYYVDTIGYKVSNGDLSAELGAYLAKHEEGD